MAKRASLTNEQIRTALFEQTKNIMHLRLDAFAVQRALLKRGILTEADIDEARKEVHLEGKTAIAKISAGSRQKPPGGVQ